MAPSSPSSPSQGPQRIISLSPNTTEILHGVGAFSRVVAVSDYCTFPPEVKNLPRIGGWQNTNLERVASFRPDLVVLSDVQVPLIADKLQALGVPTVSVRSHSLEDAFNAIETIGRATGNVEEARRLLAETRAQVEEVRARAKDLPRRRVLCVVDRVPGTLRDLYAATKGSFMAELIAVAGGESIAPPAETGWGKVSKEAVVALDPEVVIDLMMQKGEGGLAEDTQAVWRELAQLRAVREGRVYPVREESVLHPSQFVGDTARRFAELIHPEVFKRDDKAPAR
ncbi:MAG TPA: ABC transporter substrate-binding protein [Pyrinomonadaceae bacterium]|nr:ABC transporter substrate-binding protein [Pyrinomonadaceae bacterium]